MKARIASVIALLILAAPAAAQQATGAPALALQAPSRFLTKDGLLFARRLNTPPFVLGTPERHRPAALPALYAAFVGLEIMDGYSTSRGLAKGAAEGNPFIRWAVEHRTTLWAAKGGAAAASIFAAERLWKHNRRAQAIAVMVASNAFMGLVVARNASAISRVENPR